MCRVFLSITNFHWDPTWQSKAVLRIFFTSKFIITKLYFALKVTGNKDVISIRRFERVKPCELVRICCPSLFPVALSLFDHSPFGGPYGKELEHPKGNRATGGISKLQLSLFFQISYSFSIQCSEAIGWTYNKEQK